ncbi:MAG: hypothetical protein GSR79_03825 [Desulfurococcales archaeon]|nr:hypothetical protein [Desulfurococcales archaeon]
MVGLENTVKKGRESSGEKIRLGEGLVFDRSRNIIFLSKQQLLPEDRVALGFAKVLEDTSIDYVLVAGYTAILFGRGRRSDDIDFILNRIGEHSFMRLCEKAQETGFTVMQGDISSEEAVKTLYYRYLAQGYSIRFMYKDMILPNVEAKLASTNLHRYALTHSVTVVINNESKIRISPLELQITYKLYLGSDKDIGDAVFLYTLFKEAINNDELDLWCKKLKVNCNVLEADKQ